MPSVSEILMTMDYGPSLESSDEAMKWLAAHAPFGHFINGAFTAPGPGFATNNPATGELLAEVSQGTVADVTAAVAAARAAQPGWAALGGPGRARFLYALARGVQKRERLLSVLETLDSGKPIREARDADLPLVARHFYHHAGQATLLEETFPGQAALGVCGQVIPWNFPLLMLAWKVAPALAAGNTVVLKPAEQTPLTALAFAGICAEIGLPPGVVNIVTGDGETGAALVAAEVDKIAFTGSTEVGRAIRRATAGRDIRLTLELGGKSPFIVMDDADLDAAVEGVVNSIWFNAGQVCCAGSRILVAEAVAERFTDLLWARLSRLRVGNPLDKSIDIGAVVSVAQRDRIAGLLAEGRAAGAVLVEAPCALPEGGAFCAPGFLTGVLPANPLADAEIFGPYATLTTFRTPEEAVQLANASRYGLAASIWSETIGVATALAARVKAGVVWINGANRFDAAAPFGGVRESGFGREGGVDGMTAYLRGPVVAEAPEAAEPGFDTGPQEGLAPADGLDRTPKLYIGGAQKRADGGQSYAVTAGGALLGLAPLGGRKDIRNAVEAAEKAAGWSEMTGHARAQVLYFLAENLEARAPAFVARLAAAGGPDPEAEVAAAVARCLYYAAAADRQDGRVPGTVKGMLTLTLPAPHGVMGIVCPEAAPLLGLLSLVLPAIAAGNRVVAVPSAAQPLVAFDLAQLLDCSDVPGGVVNLVSGPRAALAKVLAQHDAVSACWVAGPAALRAMVEAESAGNLKPAWVMANRDWHGVAGQGPGFLAAAQSLKTVWLPYGA